MAKIGLKWQTKVQTDQDKRPDEDYWCQASGASGREEKSKGGDNSLAFSKRKGKKREIFCPFICLSPSRVQEPARQALDAARQASEPAR